MIPQESELIARAQALVPVLAERAAACEAARRLLPETLEDFVQAGFYRICQPRAYGGYEMSPEVLFNVAMELAVGCPSSAWCLCLIGVHNWEPGLMDPQAADDLWGVDPDIRYSSSYAPFGKAEHTTGGYRLSGRWEWSSGCDHCDWAILGGKLAGDDGPPQMAMLVPREDYRIVDTWHVAGLKGTGSNDVVVENAFVPEHRVHRLMEPSRRAFNSPIYDLPFANVFALCLCAVTQGIAEAALESYTVYLRRRHHAYDGVAMVADPFQQRRLSEVTASVNANRLRFHSVFRRLESCLENDVTVPVAVQIGEKWETQVLAHSNADLVTTLMSASGGGAQRLENPMQRYFRDIHAAVAHAFLNLDRGSLEFARNTLRD
ncbi:MAG: acyl-CoA dehydrogenase family protein [Gammaproteobacteria bacterium]|nr:acyl-CoA dehydrogenase family protein [Gammaproteobacteria bacterium]